jgi:hypothetical protein
MESPMWIIFCILCAVLCVCVCVCVCVVCGRIFVGAFCVVSWSQGSFQSRLGGVCAVAGAGRFLISMRSAGCWLYATYSTAWLLTFISEVKIQGCTADAVCTLCPCCLNPSEPLVQDSPPSLSSCPPPPLAQVLSTSWLSAGH